LNIIANHYHLQYQYGVVMRYLVISLIISLVGLPVSVLATDEVVVYSARKEHLIKPLFEAFEKETGIKVKYITDKAGPLLQRLKAEGKRSPADILMTVDAGNLWHAAESGILAEARSPVLDKIVPAHLKDPQNRWFGITVRARTIVYNKDRVKPEELSTYEALAEDNWKGRLCLRTSKKVYNQSLVAMLLSRHGQEKTTEIVSGWVANLALPPFSNDTKAMEAVSSGQCDLSIVNTYYFGRLENKDPQINLALFWPNQDSSGVHVNVSGAGITQNARHKKEALQLLEWLVSNKAQSMLAGLNMEYPVNTNVEVPLQVKNWGDFSADDINLSEAGRLQAEAVKLMDRSDYR
jgi:iron(III) transport system substrate-binding protein